MGILNRINQEQKIRNQDLANSVLAVHLYLADWHKKGISSDLCI